ncbi:hypothetical protein BDN71DRAFT_1514525 [Pleurotus eryngii]|uniref:Uncharacterized protein n=1 Tax=Pleurotus eryngii TaxID=5323 RepID=A0A9P6D8P8_PLEER|nr:hypothetical protein BDN71DRAFT_1514525 [Pleurotus eryngii]
MSEDSSECHSSELLCPNEIPTSKLDINKAYSAVDLQGHITQLLHQIALEQVNEKNPELASTSSPPTDLFLLPLPAVKLPQGANMEQHKAICSRHTPVKGKASETSPVLNKPPCQHTFHVWKSESGGPPILVIADSDSDQTADLFRNAVMVEEGEDSFILQVPDSQGAHGLAAAINAANLHNQATLDEILEEEKENVSAEDKETLGKKSKSSMFYSTLPSPLQHPTPTSSTRTPQEEPQVLLSSSNPPTTSPTQDSLFQSTTTSSSLEIVAGVGGED